MSSTSPHEVKRPVAQVYDPKSGDKAPLAALLAALAKAPNQLTGMANVGSPSDAAFTARLCSALSLQRDSLLSNIHQSKNAQDQTQSNPQLEKKDQTPTEHSSSQGPLPSPRLEAEGSRDAPPSLKNDVDMDASSADVNANTNVSADPLLMPPLSEEAKKKRRQEINRESARRVRKRKTEAHVQLQEEVIALKAAASSAAADQAVIVRYASELTKERDALMQRSATLENKWIAAECRNVILRQRIADLTGSSLQMVAPDTGQLISNLSMSEQQTEGTAPESSTHFNLPSRPGPESKQKQSDAG